MLLAAALIGISRLVEPTSTSLEQALPEVLVNVWYALMTVGSTVCLLGIFWRDAVSGLLIERAGMFSLCSAGLVYTVALISAGGWRAVAAASFVLAFGVACAVRAVDIGRILVRIKALQLVREEVLNNGDDEGS
jgi:hypothetical protein